MPLRYEPEVERPFRPAPPRVFRALGAIAWGGGPCNVLHFAARHHPAGLASSGGLGIARRSRHCPVVPASRGGPDVVLQARHHPAGLAFSGGLGIARQGLRQELGGYWTDMVLENHVLAVTASCQDGVTDSSFLRAVKAQVTIFSRFYCSHYSANRWFLSTISVQKKDCWMTQRALYWSCERGGMGVRRA